MVFLSIAVGPQHGEVVVFHMLLHLPQPLAVIGLKVVLHVVGHS